MSIGDCTKNTLKKENQSPLSPDAFLYHLIINSSESSCAAAAARLAQPDAFALRQSMLGLRRQRAGQAKIRCDVELVCCSLKSMMNVCLSLSLSLFSSLYESVSISLSISCRHVADERSIAVLLFGRPRSRNSGK